MGMQVCMGASMKCTFGMTPSALIVLPTNRVIATNVPAATVMDHVPIVNIPPFGMCQSLLNPTVSTATTAAQGVLTPMPCVPVTPAPWAPGAPNVVIGNIPALDNMSKLACNWGGVISIVTPGQAGSPVNVP